MRSTEEYVFGAFAVAPEPTRDSFNFRFVIMGDELESFLHVGNHLCLEENFDDFF